MHGQGTFMWSKGDMYDGDWKAGKMHGHGVKKMGNGDVYEGMSPPKSPPPQGTCLRRKRLRRIAGRFVVHKS